MSFNHFIIHFVLDFLSLTTGGPASRRLTSAFLGVPLRLILLKHYKFAAIHFNNGLHGWGYSEDQYRDGLLKFLATVKENAGDAKLIWATTTPVRQRSDLQQFGERTERVKERNKIAAEIMKERNVPINDLYGLVEEHPDWHSGDGVHFNGKGKEAQAKQVAESVEKLVLSGADQ